MSDAPTFPPMGAPEGYDPDPEPQGRLERAWAWASPKVAVAGKFVRVVGPYLAFAAFVLAIISIRGLERVQEQDNARAIAADIAGCQVGNLRLDGQIEGNSAALAELTRLVADRADLQLGLSDAELLDVAHQVAEKAMRNEPKLFPRDCSTIPGVSVEDLEQAPPPALLQTTTTAGP